MTDAEIVPMRFYLDSAITTGVSGGPVVGSDGVLGMCTQMGAQETYTIAVSSRTILQTFRGWAGLPINVRHSFRRPKNWISKLFLLSHISFRNSCLGR